MGGVLGPTLLLATVGVVVTGAVVAFVAGQVLDISTTTALLIGAVVASTDAAAVFAVLRGSTLPNRLGAAQGTTVNAAARKLRLDVRHQEERDVDMFDVQIPAGAPVAGHQLRDVPLPLDARVVAIVRHRDLVVPAGATRLEEGDVLSIVTRQGDELDRSLRSWISQPPKSTYGSTR